MYLACSDLSYTYPGADVPAFQSLEFTLKGPGFFSLFGLSGVGKSTLARIISGGLPRPAGAVRATPQARILYAHNAERFPGWMTVEAHLRSVTPEDRSGLLQTLIDECGMEGSRGHRFSGLSMGQKNRGNLLRYLVQDFDLLIADEVLANVDEPMRHHILGRMKALFPERTFLYISHNVIEVVRFSRRILVLAATSSKDRTRMHDLEGLDQQGGQKLAEMTIQARVYDVLRAAGGEARQP